MFIGDSVRIWGSLINAFRPLVLSDSASDLELCKKMPQKEKIIF